MKRLLTFIILFSAFTNCNQVEKQTEKQSFPLEKLIFHTSMCFGTCPTYHLQVDKDKNILLYAESVYLDNKDFTKFDMDSAKEGYFIGKVSDTIFSKLISELNSIGLDTLKFDGATCCDGSIYTIIIYYDGKRSFLQSMFPPENSKKVNFNFI